VSIADFWSKLHLTLPGRITITKTFMLSQIGYLGCILTPPTGLLNRLQQVMDNYCTGSIRIANNRKYLPANCGGMGLVNLKDFIIGLQSTWVKRCHQHGADNWRNDLLTICYGNPFILTPEMINPNRHPILYNIANSYYLFSSEYHEIGKNFMKAYIFKDKLFKRGNRDNNILCENFFGRNNDFQYFAKIARVRLEDILIGQQMKSLDEINDSLDLNLTLAVYMRLSGAIHFFLGKKVNSPPSVPVGVLQYMTSYSKGSQKIRRVLMAKRAEALKIENLNTVATFCEITGTGGIESNFLKNIWSFWNFSGQQNTVREFTFKFFNNQLGINTRVSHFVAGHGRGCTLCTLKNVNPILDKTFKHIFYDCPSVKSLHEKIVQKYFSRISTLDEAEKIKFWFFGMHNDRINLFVTFAILSFQFQIWRMKLKKEISHFSTLEQDWLHMLDVTYRLSSKIREAVLLINFDIRRRWHG
jgi:hypothetical protein